MRKIRMKSACVKSHKTDSCSITRCSGNRNNNHRSKLDHTSPIPRLISLLTLEFDTWKWLLTLICIFTFFFAVLPVPTIIFAGECYPLAYLWLIGWLCVAILLEHAVSVRKGKAKAAVKWYNNPNALDEYIEILNRD